MSPCDALDFSVTSHGLTIVSRKLSRKVAVAHARIQIRPESQTKFFWGICDHKSLETNESTLFKW